MTNKSIKYFDILEAKKAFNSEKNIIEFLRFKKGNASNITEIIETAYDIQAGSYIEFSKSNLDYVSQYSTELAGILSKHIKNNDSLIDIGTGEITTLSQVLIKLKKLPRKVYAFDISWSRIYKGIFYAKDILNFNYKALNLFVADINAIPLPDKSINITTSNHALEPNGDKLIELLNELFRITIDKLILFEPCFEINSLEGKKRMERLGYIKNLDGVVNELGGEVIEKIILKNSANPLNPTVCFIINPPPFHDPLESIVKSKKFSYTVPGTNYEIKRQENFYFSNQIGLCYPIIKGVPILKVKNAILASALTDLTV